MGFTFPVGQYNNTANRIRFSAYEYGAAEPVNFVDLYTPVGFSLSDGASYNDFHLGAITSQVDAAISAASQAFKDNPGDGKGGGRVGSALGALGTALGKSWEGLTGDTQSTMTIAADMMGGQRVKDLLAYKTRRVVNPNTHSLFTGVSMRKFSFSFTLAPKNASESETIKNIVDFFRKYLYPEVTDNGMIYRFPVSWKVIFIHNNKPDNKYMPILHDCFMDSFSSNHNPDSNSWHKDGSPVSTSFSLSFAETKSMHRESVLVRDYKDPA